METALKPPDFFISFTAPDKAWADWIAWTLNDEGFSVVYQPWHFSPGTNFVLAMNEATRCQTTIAILSDNYLRSRFTQPEWAAAFAQDPTGNGRRLIPIRIAACDTSNTLLAAIIYIDLARAKDAISARKLLLEGLAGLPPSERPEYPSPVFRSPHFPNEGSTKSTGQMHTPKSTETTLPPIGMRFHLSKEFIAPCFRAWKLDPSNALQLDIIMDAGDEILTEQGALELSDRLSQYFFTCLAVPKEELWVNLSPFEGDRIISDALKDTALGIDLLAQDYVLKQLTSSLTYPESEPGRSYWDQIYARVGDATTAQRVQTLNKVWAVPESATILECDGYAVIESSALAVLTQHDYLAAKASLAQANRSVPQRQVPSIDPHDIVALQVFRTTILPNISKDLNHGSNFSILRQAYSSMLLALWYRAALEDSVAHAISMMESPPVYKQQALANSVEQIYRAYVSAYKAGVFSYIREDPITGCGDKLPRKYFSGGFTAEKILEKTNPIASDRGFLQARGSGTGALYWIRIDFTKASGIIEANRTDDSEPPGGIDLGDTSRFKLSVELETSRSRFAYTDNALEQLRLAASGSLVPYVAWTRRLKSKSINLAATKSLEQEI